MNVLTDTIIAPATPQGQSALAVIRLSGAEAIDITNRIFRGTNLSLAPSHTIHYGWINDENTDLDEVMVSVFKSPKTFTTEDSIEISCHGSPQIVQSIISLGIKNGARLANPGEFTLRAFLNGRLDLSQAEAVADLIHSTTLRSSEIALKQLKGHFSTLLKDLRQELIDFAALIELELDFSEEDVEFAHRGRLKELIHKIMLIIKPMLDSFRWGNSIKDGIPVAIIGAPNAGKSTLLNTILNEEKALVSDIAGTTRDFIEDTLVIDGIMFRFIDTAGIRETSDILEGLGIERSKQKLREADIVLFISDVNKNVDETINDFHKLEISKDQAGIILLNKADTISAAIADPKTLAIAEKSGAKSLLITAKYKETLQPLLSYFSEYIKTQNKAEGTIISNARHHEALDNTRAALEKVLEGLSSGISTDFVAMDIREALYHLGTITGQVSTDDLLDSIFSKFCIGK
ncbi:MAG: tRNA uridine-5-carboxymethylaminomethyl(34) synthesis GTPase MnmE [Saprospiraceae bacterium]|jgi:tRNA modification GTPase|nr:tRNA uridine-5-carboxymethylaminomethyl(34) synthesis GTPase MnmE [Saprospiraceae bacterium]MBL0024362.1 tRNA uridine-5-carboxymethylaminomethyl(34) synthesis GTPase MnmE [Saprospiraceae bacterium]